MACFLPHGVIKPFHTDGAGAFTRVLQHHFNLNALHSIISVLLGSNKIQDYSTTITIDMFSWRAFISTIWQLLMKKTAIDSFPSGSSVIICSCASSAFGSAFEVMNGKKPYQLNLSAVPVSWFTLTSTIMVSPTIYHLHLVESWLACQGCTYSGSCGVLEGKQNILDKSYSLVFMP